MYWDIGKSIVEKQKGKHWGAGLIKQMAKDLKSELPGVSGFLQSNLYAMRQFYLFYHNAEILQQAAGILSSDSLSVKIPWRHHQVILSNCKHEKDALFYIQQTIFNKDELKLKY